MLRTEEAFGWYMKFLHYQEEIKIPSTEELNSTSTWMTENLHKGSVRTKTAPGTLRRMCKGLQMMLKDLINHQWMRTDVATGNNPVPQDLVFKLFWNVITRTVSGHHFHMTWMDFDVDVILMKISLIFKFNMSLLVAPWPGHKEPVCAVTPLSTMETLWWQSMEPKAIC